MHRYVRIPMLLYEPFQSKVALAPPHSCVEQVILLFQFLLPFVLSGILAAKRKPCRSSILRTLEGFNGSCIWGCPRCFFQQVVNRCVIIAIERIVMRSTGYEFSLNRSVFIRMRLACQQRGGGLLLPQRPFHGSRRPEESSARQ